MQITNNLVINLPSILSRVCIKNMVSGIPLRALWRAGPGMTEPGDTVGVHGAPPTITTEGASGGENPSAVVAADKSSACGGLLDEACASGF